MLAWPSFLLLFATQDSTSGGVPSILSLVATSHSSMVCQSAKVWLTWNTKMIRILENLKEGEDDSDHDAQGEGGVVQQQRLAKQAEEGDDSSHQKPSLCVQHGPCLVAN